MSNIFDEIYSERHRIPKPKWEDIGQYPVLVDVEQELQKIMKQHTDQAYRASEKRKVGRNEPCPRGSGLQFKRCHGK
jgi:uncharacterized protein YecA (UPF0149 family)